MTANYENVKRLMKLYWFDVPHAVNLFTKEAMSALNKLANSRKPANINFDRWDLYAVKNFRNCLVTYDKWNTS